MRKITLVYFFCQSLISISQDTISENKFSPSLNLFFGYTPKTYRTAAANNFAGFISINTQWQFNGKDKWHEFYNFPKGGLNFYFGTFENTKELGLCFGIVPSLEVKSKNETKKWSLRFGMGAAYFNKPFDIISNPNNFYIGSHFTNLTTISLNWEKRLKNKLSFHYGLSLIHASDGHTKLPNVGLNILSLNAGVGINNSDKKYLNTKEGNKLRNSFVLKFGLGMHQYGQTTKAIGGPDYPSYHLTTAFSRPYKNIHLIQGGIILAYYTSFYDVITSQKLYYKQPKLYSSTAMAFIGHEFVFGNFGFSTQLGIYFFNPFFIEQQRTSGNLNNFGGKLQAFNSNRLGLLYYPFKKKNSLNNIKSQLMFGAFIKANVAQADLFEFCMGFVF